RQPAGAAHHVRTVCILPSDQALRRPLGRFAVLVGIDGYVTRRRPQTGMAGTRLDGDRVDACLVDLRHGEVPLALKGSTFLGMPARSRISPATSGEQTTRSLFAHTADARRHSATLHQSDQ